MSVGEIEVPARPAAVSAEPAVELYSPWRIAWRRFRRDRVAMASGIFLIVLLLAIFPGAKIASTALGHGPDDLFPYAVNSDNLKPLGPWTWVPDTHQLAPTTSDFETPPPPKGTPNTLFLLGADGQLGHDLFLRLLYGGQVSLEVGIGATVIALLIGVTLGMLAGWLGGLVDGAVSRLTDLIMALPILLILLMVGTGIGDGLQRFTFWGVFNNGVVQLMLLIGAFTWYYPARITRAQMLTLRHQEYVEAARMVGARGSRIVRKHLFPHLVPSLVVFGTIMVATALMLEVGVTFLGAGIQLPTASWGTLLGQQWGSALNPTITTPENFQPWPTIVPSVAILLTVLALNQLGEGMREALDPAGVR
jgi:ABC-type dipeptide/oligopeptide/nickel transport system permease subunit